MIARGETRDAIRSVREGDPAQTRHFDAIADAYERSLAFASLAACRKQARLAAEFAAWLRISPVGDVLEIGAGTGALTRRLAPLVMPRHYVATDLSRGMLTRAASTAVPPTVEWRVADCLALDLDPGSMAAVVGMGILHHVPLEPVVAEMARVLLPGGRIAFYEPNLLNPVVFAQKRVPLLRPRVDTPGETALLRTVVARVLARHGFSTAVILPGEFVMNHVPDVLAPVAERVSRVLDRLPGAREFGGSLRILAVKRVG